jgi:hypothetical protein
VAQVHIAKINRDFFVFRRLRPQFMDIWGHVFPSSRHLHGWYMDGSEGYRKVDPTPGGQYGSTVQVP